MNRTIAQRESVALFHTYDRLPIGAVVRAEGSYIYTEDGEPYLDLVSGLGVMTLGHSHPKIVAAITEQTRRYLHLSNLFLQEPQVVLAEKIKIATEFDKVFFCNSGTEAVEGALKLSRKFGSEQGKFKIVGLANAFHGRTFGPLSLMDNPKYRSGMTPLVEGMECISTHDLLSTIDERTAAIILEPIQGEGGIQIVSEEVIAQIHRLREKFGFLIIADEIQSGIGRTGTFFAYEQSGLKPDIVVMAKALGGGLPLGAITTSERIASAFVPGTHGTTFGGNALACVAGAVVLDELIEGLLQEVTEISSWFFERLTDLQKKYPNQIKEVRGKGLMIGIDLHTDAKKIQTELLARRIITNVTASSVLRLLPPLNIKKDDLIRFLETLDLTLGM